MNIKLNDQFAITGFVITCKDTKSLSCTLSWKDNQFVVTHAYGTEYYSNIQSATNNCLAAKALADSHLIEMLDNAISPIAREYWSKLDEQTTFLAEAKARASTAEAELAEYKGNLTNAWTESQDKDDQIWDLNDKLEKAETRIKFLEEQVQGKQELCKENEKAEKQISYLQQKLHALEQLRLAEADLAQIEINYLNNKRKV